MRYAYLLINFLTVLFPVLLSFDKRVAFHKSWKYIWPGMGITGLVFLVWDVLFTVKGVWWFNPRYIIGVTIFKLPIEEILFFLTVPFSCIFIYACISHYVKYTLSDKITKGISAILIALSIIALLFHYRQLYTLVTFGLLAVLLVLIVFVWRLKWLNRFYLVYVVALIPFYLVNGVLTSVPVVLYNNAQNLGYRVGTIPLEDHFYCMALLLMNIGFFEYFSKRSSVH